MDSNKSGLKCLGGKQKWGLTNRLNLESVLYGLQVTHLQDVTDDANAPHVGAEVDLLVVDHFRGNELWRAKHDLDVILGVELSGQSKIDQFDPAAGFVHAHDVFGLQIEMEDRLPVHVLYACADLTHVFDDVTLGENEIVVDDTFEQFPTGDPELGKIKFWLVFRIVVAQPSRLLIT